MTHFSHPCRRLKKICTAYFHETCHWLKFSLNVLRALSRASPVVRLLLLYSGLATLGMAYTNYKGIKNNTNSGQITGIQEKLDTTCK